MRRLRVVFHIQSPLGDPDEDRATTSLLIAVFAGEGYTERLRAENMSMPDALRRRGDILLAKSATGDVLGIVICVCPTSPARQVAERNEFELHLLAVHPNARGNGVATALIAACEQRASSLGYAKMVLSTQPTMRAARRVYERLGYERNAVRDWSMAETRNRYLVYEKSLS
jgi:ribosomal protein S18 acetylase RimI-like enzyme